LAIVAAVGVCSCFSTYDVVLFGNYETGPAVDGGEILVRPASWCTKHPERCRFSEIGLVTISSKDLDSAIRVARREGRKIGADRIIILRVGRDTVIKQQWDYSRFGDFDLELSNTEASTVTMLFARSGGPGPGRGLKSKNRIQIYAARDAACEHPPLAEITVKGSDLQELLKQMREKASNAGGGGIHLTYFGIYHASEEEEYGLEASGHYNQSNWYLLRGRVLGKRCISGAGYRFNNSLRVRVIHKTVDRRPR
jgi:hypothetical protein